MKQFWAKWGRFLSVLFVVFIGVFTGKWHGMAGLPFLFGDTYSAVPGSPNFVESKDIPEVFSSFENKKFFDGALVQQICNHNWEGEIQSQGSKVWIENIPDTHISRLPRGGKVQWERPIRKRTPFEVNRRYVYAFREDKMDLKQMNDKNYLNKLADYSWKEMDEMISSDFLLSMPDLADSTNMGQSAGCRTGMYNLGAPGYPVQISKSNAPELLHLLHAVLNEWKVPPSGRKLTLPPVIAMLLKISDLQDKSMTGDKNSIREKSTEDLGEVEQWRIYRSNMYTPIVDEAAGGVICFKILFNHMEGCTYAGQFQDAEIHDKFEDEFAKGMKAENILDWTMNKPIYAGELYCTPVINMI